MIAAYNLKVLQQDIEIELNSNLVAFRFESDINIDIRILEQQTSKAYLVVIPVFYFIDNSGYQQIYLNVAQCSDPELNGFLCLDFSKVSNQTLFLNSQQNLRSMIDIFIYRCNDLDFYKTTVPDNCANQTDIEEIINGVNSGLKLKLLTYQYHITSQQMQVYYRNAFIYTMRDSIIQSSYQAQNQKILVKQGWSVQQLLTYQSPVQYDQYFQSYNRGYSTQIANHSEYLFVEIVMDEIIQVVKIQVVRIKIGQASQAEFTSDFNQDNQKELEENISANQQFFNMSSFKTKHLFDKFKVKCILQQNLVLNNQSQKSKLYTPQEQSFVDREKQFQDESEKIEKK
ncbi:hypothetical protein ABPG72_007916 [Tetrahymena utriculariae]